MEQYLIKDLEIQPKDGDAYIYFWNTNGRVQGVTGSYVDDILNDGTSLLEKHTEVTLRIF